MQALASGTALVAFAVALFLAITGAGTRRERIERFLLPSPLYVGSPLCGLILSGDHAPIVLSLANGTVLLAAIALVPLVVMVVAVAWPSVANGADGGCN